MFDRLIELTFLEWIFPPSCSEFPVSVCPCLVWEVSHTRLLNSHITSKKKSCFCRLASRGVLSENFWEPGDSWTEDFFLGTRESFELERASEEVSSSASCMQQGQLRDQTGLHRALFCWSLKTPWMETAQPILQNCPYHDFSYLKCHIHWKPPFFSLWTLLLVVLHAP